MKWLLCFSFILCATFIYAQTIIVDGTLIGENLSPNVFKDCSAELFSDEWELLEKQRINSAGNFTFQLHFAHNYYVVVKQKKYVIWKLLVKNRMEYGQLHYPVQVAIPSLARTKDVYEITFDKDGNRLYLKNGQPVTEITYRFETSRRDSSEIIFK